MIPPVTIDFVSFTAPISSHLAASIFFRDPFNAIPSHPFRNIATSSPAATTPSAPSSQGTPARNAERCVSACMSGSQASGPCRPWRCPPGRKQRRAVKEGDWWMVCRNESVPPVRSVKLCRNLRWGLKRWRKELRSRLSDHETSDAAKSFRSGWTGRRCWTKASCSSTTTSSDQPTPMLGIICLEAIVNGELDEFDETEWCAV